MTTLVDIDNETKPGDLDQLRKDLAAAAESESEQPSDDAPVEEKLPEKYRGKSMEDIIEMHRNAESELGRRGNELGQYKQLTDQLLDLKRRDDLVKGGADPDNLDEDDDPLPKITSEDLFDDPDAAVAKAVEARLKREERKRKKMEAQTEAQKLETEFMERHPDAAEIANDEKFVEWVNKSPSRQMLAQAAYQNNWAAGSTLLDEWKMRNSSVEEEAPKEERKSNENIEAARKASTASVGASTAADAPTGKVYRRLDLIRLKLEDPEAYADPSFQQEIMRAYSEGRVK